MEEAFSCWLHIPCSKLFVRAYFRFMLKWTTRIGLSIIALFCLILLGLYFYSQTLKPQYNGTITLKGLTHPVTVYFDNYAIPHIYAQDEPDAYYALGYVHAQERLFQMELLRRVSAGRLSDILGKDFIDIDKFFRAIGLKQNALESASAYLTDSTQGYYKAANAYIHGINAYMDNGKTPVEFTLIGIPKEHFKLSDLYLVSGYMSFSFAVAFKTDPLCEKMHRLGSQYLQDLAAHYIPGSEKIPTSNHAFTKASINSALSIADILRILPVAPFVGSNSFVAAPSRTESGKVLFANDTHIAYSQPSVWYEAHLEYPGQSFYGNFLAGFPFAAIGHNRQISWGLTMFENDDIDFYKEQLNPNNNKEYKFKDEWIPFTAVRETIKVKKSDEIVFEVKFTRHGPVMNEVLKDISDMEQEPVSMFWVHTKFPSTLLNITYELAHAHDIQETELAVSAIISPGLNVMYGDADGNIAWWAAAKLMKRPSHVNPVLFLNGSSGEDEILGYYDFKENPHNVNPVSGFIYSANNQPDTMQGILFPGYYAPDDRARRIVQFATKEKFSINDFMEWQDDITNTVQAENAKLLCNIIQGQNSLGTDQVTVQALHIIQNWSGSHEVDDVAPTIYYKWLYHVLCLAMQDELGEDAFNTFLQTPLMKNSIHKLLSNENAVWWDDVHSGGKKLRALLCTQAFNTTLKELKQQFGSNVSDWQWGRAHTLVHVNALGKKKPLNYFFNVGPMPAPGGMETLNSSGFVLNSTGKYPATYGPALRILLDFNDIENSLSINPTGQSGVFSSPHYDDQALLYINCKYRKQMMNKEEIEQTCKNKLVLTP